MKRLTIHFVGGTKLTFVVSKQELSAFQQALTLNRPFFFEAHEIMGVPDTEIMVQPDNITYIAKTDMEG